MRRSLLVLALTLASLMVASTPTAAQAIAFPWTQVNDQQRLREQHADRLRSQIVHWRHLARTRAAQIGVSLPVEPLRTGIPYLLWLRSAWHQQADHYATLVAAYQAPTATATPTYSGPTPSGSVYANLLCIHPFEEPSWSTVAGGLGFVSPPSAYNVGSTDALAAQYGDSWYTWPESAQLEFGAQLVAAYGYSPWSTAYRCGL